MSDGEVRIDVRASLDRLGGDISKASKELNKLTSTFDKQRESISKQNAAIEKMKSELEKISSGEVTPKGLSAMETAWRRQTDLAERLGEETQEYRRSLELARQELVTLESTAGVDPDKIEAARTRVDELTVSFNLADIAENNALSTSDSLAQQIERIRLNPETSQAFQDLRQRIVSAESALQATVERANETRQSIANLMELDESPFVQSVRGIQNEIEGITTSIERQRTEFATLSSLYDQSAQDLEEARRNGDALAESLAQSNLDRIRADIDRMDSQLRNSYFEAERLRTSFENITLDPRNVDDAQRMRAEISALTFSVDDAVTNSRDLSGTLRGAFPASAVAPLNEGVETVARNTNKLKGITDTVGAGFKRLGSIVKGIGSAGAKGLGALGKKVIAVGKNANNSANAFDNALKKIKGLAIGAFIFSKISNAIGDLNKYMGGMLKTNDEYARSMNAIKVNMMTAFNPIYEAILPAINALSSGLATVTGHLASFLSMLGGKTYAQSKEATKALQQQSAAMKKVGSDAKKGAVGLQGFDEVNVAMQDNAEAGADVGDGGISEMFDVVEPPETGWIDDLREKLEGLFDPFDRGYAIGEALAEQFNSMLGMIDWDSAQDKARAGADTLAGTLNGLIENVKWKNLGNEIAGGLNTALEFVNRAIDKFNWKAAGKALADTLTGITDDLNFDKLGETIAGGVNGAFGFMYEFLTTYDWGDLGVKIGSGMNKIVEKTDFGLIGKTFGAKWNAIVNTLHGIVTTFKWEDFGTGIADGVNGLFSEIDWAKTGETISEGIKGALSTIGAAIRGIEWKQIGKDISTLLAGIDWKGIVANLARVMGNALGGLFMLLYGFLEDAVTSIGDYFNDIFLEMGDGNIIGALFVGIGRAIVGVGKWLYDNVFTPFINGFKEMFDINSPSKVMADLGEDIINGLKNGISALIQSVVDLFTNLWDGIKKVWEVVSTWFDTNVIQPVIAVFSDLRDNIKEFAVNAWNGIVEVWTVVSSWFDTNIIQPVLAFFISLWDNIKELAVSTWNGIVEIWILVSTWFDANIIQPLIEFFTGMWDNIKELAINAWDTIVEIWSVVSEWFNTNIIQPLVTFFTNLKDNMIELLQNAWDTIVEIWSVVSEWFNTNIIQPLVTFFTNLRDKIKELTTAAWEGVKATWSVVSNWFNTSVIQPVTKIFTGLWDGIKNMANTALTTLKNAWATIPTFFTDKVFTPVKNGFKGFVNGLIGTFEGFINGIIRGINGIISGFNSIRVSIPDWVPGFGGRTFSLNLSSASSVSLPRLAQGGAVYGETMAIVGDNPRANIDPEIVAPLSKISSTIMAQLENFTIAPQVMSALTENGANQTRQQELSDATIAKLLNGVAETIAVSLSSFAAERETTDDRPIIVKVGEVELVRAIMNPLIAEQGRMGIA